MSASTHAPVCTARNLNGDRRLVIHKGGEDLAALAWDGFVAINDVGHDAAGSLNAQRERRDIEQHHVLRRLTSVAAQDRGLHSGTCQK